MPNTENVCRFCLKIIPTDNSSPFDATYTEKIQFLVPDVKLTPCTNPVVCNVCKNTLEESHKLKRTCSSSNKLIKFLKNYLGIKHSIELKELIKGNNKKEDKRPRNGHVCRICLKSNEGEYTNFSDAKSDQYGSTLTSCLSTLDENLTASPLICKICIDTLHKMCNFVKQLTDAEGKVKSFCEKVPSENVDLFRVVNFTNDGERQQFPSQDEDVQNNKHRPSGDLDGRSPAKKQKTQIEPDEEDDYDSDSPSVEQHVTPGTSGNELPHFDFSVGAVYASFKCKRRIEDWVKRVDEIRAERGWSEATTKHKVLARMRTLPKVHSWFSSIADVVSWADFREKLVYAFPAKDDYYMDVLRMTKRKKRQNETYVEYFDAKLELLRSWNLSDEQTVSCLLGGVPNVVANCIGRMGRYKTPAELLAYFKSCDDKEKIKSSKSNETRTANVSKSPDKSDGTDEKAKRPGADPVKKNLIVVLENRRLDVNEEKLGEKSTKKPHEANRKCSYCDRNGHSGANCPLVKPHGDRVGQNSKLIIVHENRLISSGTDAKIHRNVPDARKKEPETPPTKDVSTGRKCACCDKPGHASANCPLVGSHSEKPGQRADDTTAKSKDVTSRSDQGGKKCSYCDNTGHSSLVCPLIETGESSPRRANIKIVLDKDRLNRARLPSGNVHEVGKDDLICESKERSTQKQTEGNASQKRCSRCDKVGHTSLNCPVIGASKNVPGKSNADRPGGNASAPQKCSDDKKCSRCDKVGHTNLNCPVIGPSKNAPGKSGTDRSGNNASAPQTRQKCSDEKKCSRCDKFGHTSLNCPVIALNKNVPGKSNTDRPGSNASASQTSQKCSDEKKCSRCDKVGHTSLNCLVIGPNKNVSGKSNTDRPGSNASAPQKCSDEKKCSCCNKIGHTSVNCPVIGPSKNVPAKSSTDRPGGNASAQKCTNCNKFGHSSLNCSVIKINERNDDKIDIKLSSRDKPETQTMQKCTCCDKLGHTSANCPSMGVNENVAFEDGPSRAQTDRRCLCCNETGHSSLDCPLLNADSDDLPAGITKSSQVRNPTSSERKCSCCSKSDHATPDCPFYGFFNKNDAGDARDAQKLFQKAKGRPQTADAADQPPHKKPKGDPTGQKHSQTPTEARATETKLEAPKTARGGALRCEFCDRAGHRLSECFFARFDRKIYDAHHGAGGFPSRQCLYCGKFGHQQPDCPKNKASSSRRIGFRPSHPGPSRN